MTVLLVSDKGWMQVFSQHTTSTLLTRDLPTLQSQFQCIYDAWLRGRKKSNEWRDAEWSQSTGILPPYCSAKHKVTWPLLLSSITSLLKVSEFPEKLPCSKLLTWGHFWGKNYWYWWSAFFSKTSLVLTAHLVELCRFVSYLYCSLICSLQDKLITNCGGKHYRKEQ